MFYKYIKLTNGDDIIAETKENVTTFTDKDFVDICDPVQISSIRIPRGPLVVETYMMQPWIKMADAKNMQLPTKNIIVIVDVQEATAQHYKQYVSEHGSQNFTDLTSNDEYNEEEAQDDTDDFYESITPDDEDDGIPRNQNGRTIH